MKKSLSSLKARIVCTFLTDKPFSGLSPRALLYGVLFSFLLIFAVADQYMSVNCPSPTTRIKKKANQKTEVEERYSKIKSFRTKIDSLKLQLTNLTHLAERIRSAASSHNTSAHAQKLGVGGSPANNISRLMADPAKYNQMVKELDNEINRLDYAAVDHLDEYQVLLETVREIKKFQDATPSICPIEGGEISSKFGYRVCPWRESREFHSGLDISTRWGTPVKAAANGLIAYAGYNGDLGKTVIIDHGFGIATQYCHLSDIKVKPGWQIKRADVIGKVGCTGRSTGPHLHYEVSINDVPVNPKKYIPEFLANKDPSK